MSMEDILACVVAGWLVVGSWIVAVGVPVAIIAQIIHEEFFKHRDGGQETEETIKWED